MSDRLALIARLGAAMAAASDPALQAVLADALAAIVDDHGVIAAQERRKAKDRNRKRSTVSTESTDSKESAESTEGAEVSPPSPMVSLINPSFPPPPSLPAERTIVRTSRAGPPRADVEAVVAHYVARFPKRRPGEKDRKLIAKHLGTYSAAELCEAIDGNADDEWAQKTGKHELAWTLRDNGQIDTYRAKADVPPVAIKDGWFADVAS